MRRIILAVLFFTAVASSAQMKESITVNFVEIPVTVVDRDGNPVKGLKPSNFELVDEGKQRSITSFDAVDFSSAESVRALSPMNPAARRNFLLVFDLSFSSPVAIGRAQEAARNFVATMVARRDRVGVATIDVSRGFRLLTAFTTDRTLVDAAIANPRSFQGNDPLQLAGVFPVQEAGQFGGTDLKGHATEELNDLVRRQNQVEDQYNRQRIDRQIGLLSSLAGTLRAVSGQKRLILLSEGFDPRLIQGRDASTTQQQVDESVAVERGEIWKVDTDNRYGSSNSLSILDRMSQTAKRSDVVIDAIDIRGVRTNVDPSQGYERHSNEGLHLLANSTGGTVFKNTNDLASDFKRVVRSQEVVYILGFQAPTAKPGSFHAVKVKLVDVPGARLSHRAGYYEPGVETPAERSLSNAEIVLNDIPQAAVRVAALTAAFPTSSANAQVPVILEIDGRDIQEGGNGKTSTLEIYTYAFDEEGLVRDSVFQRVTLELAKNAALLKSGGVKYYATLSLPPGTYAVKSLVRVAENDRKGFSRTLLDVPAAGTMSVSRPFFFEAPGKWIMLKGGSHDRTQSPYPFEVGGEPFIPSASVSFAPGETRRFAVFVLHAAPDDVIAETQPPARLVSKVGDGNGSKFIFELAPPDASVRTVEVTVSRKGSGEKLSSAAILTTRE